jgi:hypothetical protein
MEVTRQLRRERPDKKGLAPIQLTFCWGSQRLRLPSGQKCLPKDWDEKRGHTKAKPGTYLDDINQVLNRYQDAATAAAHAAGLAGRTLDKDTMRTEIEQRYLRLAQEASGEVPKELPPPHLPTEPTFLEHF